MGSYTTCQVCQKKVEFLPCIEHIKPKSEGIIDYIDNLFVICEDCHFLGGPTPPKVEFINFLSDLLRDNGQFTDIAQDAIFGKKHRFRADILANHDDQIRRTRLLVECESPDLFAHISIGNVISQLNSYKEVYGECQPVFAIPATLRDADAQALKSAGIQLWDLDFLTIKFAEQLANSDRGYFRSLLSRSAKRGPKLTREDQLSTRLKECEKGTGDWSLYQSLIGDILEHLFCPPLTKPLSEHADHTKTNRRDFILSNYAESGFWHFMQRNYMADFVVVDAKNGAKKVGKSEILQVANYLKPHGTGLFGMIFSRQGCDVAGGLNAMREQWVLHQKLILVFSDEDVHSMLIAKRDGRHPEEVVKHKIESFRLSL